MMRREAIVCAVLIFLNACAGSTAPPPIESPVVFEPAFAEVTELSGVSPVTGTMAEGGPGDWLMQNEQFSVVIRGLHGRTGFALSGGNIIDAAPTGGEDVVREIFTYFDDVFPRQAVYEKLGEETHPDSTAVSLVARGYDSQDSDIAVETRYTIRPSVPYLEIVTTLTNQGTQTLTQFELGDGIEWGRTAFFAPGPGHRLPGTRDPVPFLLGHADGTSYGWVNPGGDLTGPHGHIWSDPIVKTVDLTPDERVSYVRRLIVKQGSPSRVAEAAWTMRGQELGSLSVRVEDDSGHAVAGASVIAQNADNLPMTWGETSAEGIAVLFAPAGEYAVDVAHPNRGNAAGQGTFAEAGSIEELVVELPEPARLSLSAGDSEGLRSPARWTLTGLDDTQNPQLGPSYQITGAGNYVFTAEGRGEALVPPGTYRVTATRGPAYESWEKDVVLHPGESMSLAAEIERLVPENWVAADFHVHSIRSHDSGVTLEDRARSLVCEGIDWFAGSDHDHRSDFEPVVETLDLAAPLHALVGEEITTSQMGHFNAFPLGSDPERSAKVRLPAAANNVDAIFSRLREAGPDVLIQVNHPRAGRSGYFDQMGYVSPDSAASEVRLDFDLLEIMNGRTLQGFEAVWKDWMGLLRSGRKIVGVGNSDSHHLVGQEVGYPRNYVQMDSLSGQSDEDAFLNAVREGRVVVSNGPFIEFTLEDGEVGSTVTHSAGVVKGHVRVIAPAWVDVRRVAVYVNGVEDTIYMVRGRERPVRFDEDIEINIRASSFVVVRVEGEASLAPVLSPAVSHGDAPPRRPLAFTNPIWIEVAGASR